MVQVRCEKCGASYELDEKTVDKNSEYSQCPFCGDISRNQLKDKIIMSIENEHKRRK